MSKRDNVKIIMDGFNAEPPLSDDAILEQLYAAGVKFPDLRTVFNDIIKEKGLRLTNKERKAKTSELMEDTTEINDAEEMLKIVAMLQDKLKVTTTKAMGSLRTWAKGAGIELPKIPKASKPRKVGFSGHYKKILDYIMSIHNDNEGKEDDEKVKIDKAAVVAFCHSQSIPEAYASVSLNVVHFAQQWAGEIEVEAEEAEETEEAA